MQTNDSYVSNIKDWYNNSYGTDGVKAQRRYPNEELCRFMGRNFFDKDISLEQRKNIRILELGCGSCANVWMLAKEGFDAYGCDLSESAIKVGQEVLKKWGTDATLVAANMMLTPFDSRSFDVVIDVLSSTCLNRADYLEFQKEALRLLKSGGLFFSVFPSKSCDVFLRSTPETRIDDDTLKTQDELSPFYGNDYPWRYMSQDDVKGLFVPENGFSLSRMEKYGRTYRDGQEYFEFLVFEATRA